MAVWVRVDEGGHALAGDWASTTWSTSPRLARLGTAPMAAPTTDASEPRAKKTPQGDQVPQAQDPTLSIVSCSPTMRTRARAARWR
jgi:hypothetical protein